MKISGFKYCLSFLIPICTLIAFSDPSKWAYLTLVVAFVLIPLLELFLPQNQDNFNAEEENILLNNKFFDLVLLGHFILHIAIVYLFLNLVSTEQLTWIQLIGVVLSMGISNGVSGINVAHELGHRQHLLPKFCAQLLLASTLYVQFFVEHNFGHHKYVATPEDPATARKGESVYGFWVRSMWKGYFSSWKIQMKMLGGKSFFGIENKLFWLHILEFILCLAIILAFGLKAFSCFLGAALIGILLLETVNYVEHYGLLRHLDSRGRYERVMPIHSWNSNHTLGRIVLFELTRHSDHHFDSTRKYQILRHHDQSPQLPFGYPGSMLLALTPSLWRKIVHPLLQGR